MINKTIFIGLMFFSFYSYGQNYAFRARENYDFLKFSGTNISEKYAGLSSTINLYNEIPYNLSYGLSLTLPLGTIQADGVTSPLGEEIDLWQFGGDIKYFPLENLKAFLRGTLTYTLLKSDRLNDDPSGVGFYVGLGWEVPIYKGLALAPEVGYRHMELENDLSANSLLLSLGLHFYSINAEMLSE